MQVENLEGADANIGPVIDLALPTNAGVPILVRSFAACLASVTEVPIAQIPQPQVELRGAVDAWRTWLAGRGAGLVPIADPGRFNWPGYWIAILGPDPRQGVDQPARPLDRAAVVMFGTPAGVVLSPQVPGLLGRAAAELPVQEGYLLASLDPVLAAPMTSAQLRGTVEAIAIAQHARGPVSLVDSARALAGRGLAGDRYATGAGTFTPADGNGRGYDLTLIQAEVLEELQLPEDRRLDYGTTRRNLVTRGIDLNALVGRRFRIAGVECLGQRLCEPCAHLERLTTTGVLRGLIHRGGLRADILTDGYISTGASIESTD